VSPLTGSVFEKASKLVVVHEVEVQVAQLLQRRVRGPDLVEPGQPGLQRGCRWPAPRRSRGGAQLVLLRVQVLLAARADRLVLVELVAGVDAQDGDSVAASVARMANVPRPPCCSDACRMSGVFTNRFGLASSARAACSTAKSVISCLPVRRWKYV